MKTKMKILATTAISLAFFAPTALAEPDKRDGKGRPDGDRPSREKILEKFDTDGDGKISKNERFEMIKVRLDKSPKFKKNFTKRADKNGDGELSNREIKAAMKARGKRGSGRADGKRPSRGRPGGA